MSGSSARAGHSAARAGAFAARAGNSAARSGARPADATAARARTAWERRPVVTLYSKPGCHLCETALAALGALRDALGFELRERDITRDEALHRAYFERIPVVALDGEELCEYVLDEQIVRERLESRA